MTTETESRPPPSESAAFRFLDLPPEIRDCVYRELVSADINRRVNAEGIVTYKFHLDIFRASKQVYAEARHAFRRHNVIICVDTPWKQAEQHVAAEGLIPLLAVGKATEGFWPYHLHAVVEVPEMGHAAASSFVVLLQDLEAFCQMWFYSDLTHPGLNSHLSLDLKLGLLKRSGLGPNLAASDANLSEHHPLPVPLQKKLLAPFDRVKGIARLRVENADLDTERDLRKLMAVPPASPEQCLDEAARLKELGNKAMKQHDPNVALDCYFRSFHAMHIVVEGHRRNIYADAFFEKDLVGGAHNGQYGGIVRMVLRVQLVANIIAAYLRLERFKEARFWGMRSINLMRDALGPSADEPRPAFPAPDSYGKIYFRTALACKYLGEVDHARDLLRIATAWLPNDPIVRDEAAAAQLPLPCRPPAAP